MDIERVSTFRPKRRDDAFKGEIFNVGGRVEYRAFGIISRI